MASSNVNTGFAKCFISFMALVILLQGCVYLALAIYGITQESCHNNGVSDITENPFEFIMRLIYFQKESCGNPKVTAQDLPNEIVVDMNWSKSFAITNRTFIFLITYAAVSALWIATSVLVLASICGRVTRFVAAISFWPWFLIVIGGSILDGVATGYFVDDIIHTTTASDTFGYIGADTTNTELMSVLEKFDAYFITPAVVMVCLSSRLVLIWLLNIFGTGFCLSLSHVLAKNNSTSSLNEGVSNSSPTQAISEASTFNAQSEIKLQQPEVRPNQSSLNPQTSVIEQIRIHQQASINSHGNTPPTPLIDPPKIRRLSSISTSRDSEQLNPAQNNVTYRNTDTHPDRLDYPAVRTRPISPELPMEQVSQLSVETPLNSRYSIIDGSQQPNARVNAELRSQLPWSYTNILGNPQVPLKPQRPIYPDIPKPDYNS
ncbi:unnamed protein product [Ceratitis capitata]|uniref:(Mediterranean fruit fly) hypothetical protein n=1 Tax=Ceratitis capitata TaxID=7213 RepID=A0A811V1V6_CERCA|nr:unnamed protein product [Ceratitis capitata]